MLQTITIDQLKIGMYVKDVTWAGTKFKVKTQGIVKSQKTIEQLKRQGVIDLLVEYTPVGEAPEEMTVASKESAAAESNMPASPKSLRARSLEDEFSLSCQLYDKGSQQIQALFDLNNTDERPNASAINELASEITDSIIRNEYAMTMLTRIRNKSTYQWEHAINCGILLCGFSLYLGLKKETATQIALGGILHDIGTAKVSPGIINKAGKLTENDTQVIRRHVAWGFELCKKEGMANKIIVDMMANHHERLNGSGYPRGVSKNKLSKLARMTAIVDVYDAMTGDKPYKPAEPPINALRYLMAKNEHFDRNLVQQFIKFLGIHPVGSLVKLSNDRLAVVTRGNRSEPVKPLVKVFYNLKHNRYITSTDCDLSHEEVKIVASVRPQEHKINLGRILREIIA